jgi:hypothetical protein
VKRRLTKLQKYTLGVMKLLEFCRGDGCTQAECVRALNGLALPRASHFGEIALSGSRRLQQRQSFSRMLLSL